MPRCGDASGSPITAQKDSVNSFARGRMAASPESTPVAHRAALRRQAAAHDRPAARDRARAVRRQGSPRCRGGLSARQRRRSAHLALHRLPHAASCSRPTASSSGTTSAPAAGATRRPPRRHHDHLIDIETRPGDRVPQRGDRGAPGAGGARARLQPGRPQARALRRADQAQRANEGRSRLYPVAWAG